MKDLAKELSIAMVNHPTKCVMEIIADATKVKFASRTTPPYNILNPEMPSWKLSNSDIHAALKYYNKLNSY